MGSPADYVKNKGAEKYTFKKSMELFGRAAKVVPAGIYGHQSPALCVPGSYPFFIEKTQGTRFWDVDGNEFIDYMCGYGPMVVGYNNPNVEKAVAEEKARRNCANLPGSAFVELAERLTGLIPFADWVLFGKNGSDVTTWALMVARAHTGKKKILMAEGTYHGSHAWCTPMPPGVIKEDRQNIVNFKWNDIADFRAKAESVKDDFAGVIVTPFRHEAFHDSVEPAPGFHEAIREECDKRGALMILDDVRAGLRLDLRGSNYYYGGYEPDLACYCKAIANGYPLSAAAGRKKFMNTAASVFATGSYWTSTAPMAASLATIDELEKTNGIETMKKMGELLMGGLEKLAAKHGLQVLVSGPPAIPYIRFKNETTFERQKVWCAEAASRGIFFHPHHNWFMSSAHTENDIEITLNVADIAFSVVKDKFGS